MVLVSGDQRPCRALLTNFDAPLEVAVPKHTLTLGRVPAKALVEVVSALVEGARLASRLVGAPDSEIEVVSLAGGVVELEAPAVLDGETAIDVFADALSTALSERRESVFADGPLLEVFVRFSRSSTAGLDLARSNGKVLSLRPADVAVLEHLFHVTPGNRAVRVVGDLKPESTPGMATLVVPNGDSVRVRFAGLVPVGARTVVSGIGSPCSSLTRSRQPEYCTCTVLDVTCGTVKHDSRSDTTAFCLSPPGFEFDIVMLHIR